MRIITAVLLVFCFGAAAQPAEYRLSRAEYIEKYKDEAIREMMMHGIPASIKLAQALVETGDGNSPLAKYANNHFGIKCHGWKSFNYSVDDDAYNECFRKYGSVVESYQDHSKFLLTRPWYKPLFELRITDYAGWAKGLKSAGYATHPEYAEMLIRVIEEEKLYVFDYLDTLETKGVSVHLEKSVAKPEKKELLVASSLKHVITKQGDTFTRLALKHNISLRKLHEYNDLERDVKMQPGMIIYLEPKKLSDQEIGLHLVMNETLHEISQVHGIKLSALIALNPWLGSRSLADGDILRLNHLQILPVETETLAISTTDLSHPSLEK